MNKQELTRRMSDCEVSRIQKDIANNYVAMWDQPYKYISCAIDNALNRLAKIGEMYKQPASKRLVFDCSDLKQLKELEYLTVKVESEYSRK